MNERIRELAEQAGMTNDKFGMFFAKDKHNEDGVDLEKFAELIVRECIEIVQEGSWMVTDELVGQQQLARSIKRHFGVAGYQYKHILNEYRKYYEG